MVSCVCMGGCVVEEEISIELMRCLFAIGSGVFVIIHSAERGQFFLSRFKNTEYMTADICMMREAYKI